MIKKTIVLFILVQFNSFFAGESEKPDYFPLQIGNKWVYEHTELPKEITTRFNIVEIIDTTTINNKKYYNYSEIVGSFWGYSSKFFGYWHIDSLKQVWSYNPKTHKEEIFLGFNYPLGQTIVMKYDSSNNFTYTLTLMDTNETVLTSAGKFNHCLYFRTEIVEIYTDFKKWYAPNIGKVLGESEGEGLVLYGACIDGVVYGDTCINIVNHIREKKNKINNIFQLDQNYPNPFNNVTTIQWSINSVQSVPVKLTIFNLQGKEVITLIDKYLLRGFYQTQWVGCDKLGNNVSSGIYFYSLKVDQQKKTNSFLLIK